MTNWQAEKQWYSEQDLAQRQIWYADVVADYNRVRPRYPDVVIEGAIVAAQLTPPAPLLEIGCGPGVITFPLAQRGFQLTALEPNPRFYTLMQQKAANIPQIQVENLAFEQWPLQPGAFAAVVAANALHWVDPSIAYAKAAQALQPNGHLILFWHMKPEPQPEIFQLLWPAYADLPPLFGYEGAAQQRQIAQGLGQEMLSSGYFQDLQTQLTPWSRVYSTADYLALLGTFSPYLRLGSGERDRLFEQLKTLIDQELGGKIELFNCCVFQVGRVCD
ncbi:MAG: class I SAM-dependent methyltransferase [Cyanobacteria bacterium P01_G01_bin.54]